jgi:hypothetical protein
MRLLRLSTSLALLAATTVWASSSFDPVSATGHVPGHDVQTLMGWTEAQFQERAPAITFILHASGQFTGTCVGTGPDGSRFEEDRTVIVDWQAPVISSLRHDMSEPGRVDGFQLLGLGATPDLESLPPAPGGPCPLAQGSPGTWLSLSSQLQAHALLARFGGVDVRLPF